MNVQSDWNGGFNLVAHLGAAGHTMRLHDIDDAKLTALRTAGGIDTSGMGTGFAKLEHVTTDLAAAINGADVIIVCTCGLRSQRGGTNGFFRANTSDR